MWAERAKFAVIAQVASYVLSGRTDSSQNSYQECGSDVEDVIAPQTTRLLLRELCISCYAFCECRNKLVVADVSSASARTRRSSKLLTVRLGCKELSAIVAQGAYVYPTKSQLLPGIGVLPVLV
jgi:hypothetical protein